MLILVALASTFLLIILWLYPENAILLRLENIFSGDDTSGKGRTSDAFILADQILEKKNAELTFIKYFFNATRVAHC